MIGTRLAHYDITSHLGSGGMGDVYEATDTKLGRSVAIKFLPEAFSHDTERVARFQREARVLASLNHPNIAAIHGVEEINTRHFLVMELVPGETLANRIERGAIPIEQALPIARQIADALEEAHEKGVIHRDLKPANVKVTPDGKVKLLDFGLARLFEAEPQNVDRSNSPTMVSRADAGIILGTASYMSPEQARGRDAGKQSDIWAFGCVVYEMLTGKQSFTGETITDVLSGIIKGDPDWEALPQAIPQHIDLLLRRCLHKDLRHRIHDIADARIEIEEGAARDWARAQKYPARWAWLLTAVMAAALLVGSIAAFGQYFGRPAPGREVRLQVITPPSDDLLSFAISPDGQRLVFAASTEGKTQLWIRALDSVSAEPLAGTEGATYPFWAPDNRSLGFFADGKLKRVDIAGGPPRVLANAPLGRGGTWNHDDVIVYSPSSSGTLYRVSATGASEAIPVTKLESPRNTAHRFPQFLPDGKHFVFNSLGNPEGRGVYLGSLDSGEAYRLFDADSHAVYVSAGYLLFVRQGIFLAQRFDTGTFQLVGEPIAVAEDVISDTAMLAGAFCAGGGIFAYRAGTTSNTRQLVWFNRSGKSVGTVGPPDRNSPFNPNISPDGQHVALDRQVKGNTDIWLLETVREVATRFTTTPATERGPVWSPDGTRIAFSTTLSGKQDLYEKPSGGGQETPLLVSSSNTKLPIDWSRDGRFILYREIDPMGVFDLWALPMFGDRKPIPIANTTFEERDGQFSPDGRWVAYRSNESGRFEVYVQQFQGPVGKSPIPISTNGGTQPRWRHDGKELFYISLDNKLMAVSIGASSDGTSIKPGAPVQLFAIAIAGGPSPETNNQQYAISADDQRFLVNVTNGEASTPITLVLNWNPLSRK